MALLQEIQVPLLAVNDTTLTVVELGFLSGARVNKGDVVMVFETSKTTYDVEAGADGYIQYFCETERDYDVNTVVARIYSEAGEAAAPVAPVMPPPARTPTGASPTGASPAAAYSVAAYSVAGTPVAVESPAAPLRYWEGETLFSREATRLIDEHGIDRAAFAGRDLVTGADVVGYMQPPPAAGPAAKQGLRTSAPTTVDPAKAIVQRLTSAKKREIEYLGEVQSPGITSTIDIYIDTENIFTHINRSLKYLKDSLLPVIIYESSRLLVGYPMLNAWFTGDGVAVYHEVSPGFAIDIDKGLKVLKLARAGEKSVAEIEADILRLSGSYLDETLELDSLTDITFTITDLSSEGVAFFRPLVNKMNSAILGVSAIDNKLQRCVLSLTFDHRVTEGKLAARFLSELKERLESYRPRDFQGYKDVSCFKCFKTLKEDLGGTGFARCISPEGKEGYICQTCLKGF